MRFILGVITGFAAGTAAAMLTSGKSGAELRMEFERIRSDIQERDFEALGAQLEERLKDLQTNLDKFLKQASDKSADAGSEAAATFESAAAEASDAMESVADDAAHALEEGTKELASA